MQSKRVFLIFSILMAIGLGPVDADMVILKSGEMFQTSKAWEENGAVCYYRDGRVVRVDAQAVERLIHSQTPAKPPPPPPKPSVPQSLPNPSAPPDIGIPERLPGFQPSVGDDAGYLGVKWGQPPSQIDGLEFVQTDPAYGGVEQYSRPKARKRFVRARVDNIVFGFWKKQLYTILVEVSNYMDFLDLKAEAFRRYGEADPVPGQPDKYRWRGGGTDRQLSYDHQSDTGYLWMRSQKLHAKIKEQYPE
ncbi:hypothetical protein DSCW_29090 [Desulfosarcina widdelii]|uniref:SLA1 homology domain-containing protein n=1 Tax=Desulfosarcina widdelii TaxID=947919 RepID=A0A5K7Z0J5_9BACT|nr:hypothetical protein [Desulfosarcina widdelii]BBO75492.1 hypothetical protein DSCW_29090 [Desulfosarcina widdelii]